MAGGSLKMQKKKGLNSSFPYHTFRNDPFKTRFYTLDNGLSIVLAQKKGTQKTKCIVAVGAGSQEDPKSFLGAAHMLEHHLFKGNKFFGTENWEKEKEILIELKKEFSYYKLETSEEIRRKIWKKISKLSNQASSYCIGNEYDRILSHLGAKDSNAHTWLVETVYESTIPTTELHRFLQVESARFSHFVPRMFQAELQVVQEEFGMVQDTDDFILNEAIMKALFPLNKGLQHDTIGTFSHLESPDIQALENYFSTYYVAKNMRLILVGDFNFDSTFHHIKDLFSHIKRGKKNEKTPLNVTTLKKTIKKSVKSKSSPYLCLNWRLPNKNDSFIYLVKILQKMLENHAGCGILQENLIKKSSLNDAIVNFQLQPEFILFQIFSVPKENQPLQEIEKLLLIEIKKLVIDSDFKCLFIAATNQVEFLRIKALESKNGIAGGLLDDFYGIQSWDNVISNESIQSQISYEVFQEFVTQYFIDNKPVIVYKEQAEPTHIKEFSQLKNKNPEINFNGFSSFGKEILGKIGKDYEVNKTTWFDNVKVSRYKDLEIQLFPRSSDLFTEMILCWKRGKLHPLTRHWPLLTQYISGLGSINYPDNLLQKELFNRGIQVDFYLKDQFLECKILSSTSEYDNNFTFILSEYSQLTPNPAWWKTCISNFIEDRKYDKNDPYEQLQHLTKFAMWNHDDLKSTYLTTNFIKKLDHKLILSEFISFFLQPNHIAYFSNTLNSKDCQVFTQKSFAGTVKFTEEKVQLSYQKNKKLIYHLNQKYAQTEFRFITELPKISSKDWHLLLLFNEYFGSGPNALVFQELREKRSLAYHAYCHINIPQNNDIQSNMVFHISTSKRNISISYIEIVKLITDFSQDEEQFESSKKALIRDLSLRNLKGLGAYRQYQLYHCWNLKTNPEIQIIEDIKNVNLEQLTSWYHSLHVLSHTNCCILGSLSKNAEEIIGNIFAIEKTKLKDIFFI